MYICVIWGCLHTRFLKTTNKCSLFFLSPLERRACFLILIHLSFWVFFHLMMLSFVVLEKKSKMYNVFRSWSWRCLTIGLTHILWLFTLLHEFDSLRDEKYTLATNLNEMFDRSPFNMLNEYTCVLYLTQYSENHRHTVARQHIDSFK